MSKIELRHGDCLENMRDMLDESVDLIVTSPPYNNWRNRRTQQRKAEYWKRTNITYNSYDDHLSDLEYETWQVDVLNECYRILKPTGTMAYNHKDRIFNFEVRSPLEWILKSKMKYRQRITWDRGGMQAFNNVRFYRNEEDIYILGKATKHFTWNPDCAKYMSIWKIVPSRKNNHPAPFPEEIPERCIRAFTNEGDVVLDPFMGSGTTGVSSKKLNRHFIGIELDRTYLEMARGRINDCVDVSLDGFSSLTGTEPCTNCQNGTNSTRKMTAMPYSSILAE